MVWLTDDAVGCVSTSPPELRLVAAIVLRLATPVKLGQLQTSITQSLNRWYIHGRKLTALEQMNVTHPDYDLIPLGFGPIQAVEVKWSTGPMPPHTIDLVADQAQRHPSRTFLVESNNLDKAAIMLLKLKGGEQLPYAYPDR